MELETAKQHLAEIHRHLSRTEVYRGYRASFIGCSGCLALIGALFQPDWPAGQQRSFALYWSALAAVNITMIAGNIAYDLWRSTPLKRRRTMNAVGQLIPSLLAGFLLTWAFYHRMPEMIPLLPGLWCLLFSLGMFASRPYLPAMISYVAAYYLGSGLLLLSLAPQGQSLHPWAMGLVFGIGQMLGALVIHYQVEKEDDGPEPQ